MSRRSILVGRLFALPLLTLAAASGRAQVAAAPAASVSNSMPTANFGFMLPSRLGTLSYSLSGSEVLQTGFGGGSAVVANTIGSGNLAYLSNSERDPFSAVISAGYIFPNGTGGENTGYADIAASQVFRTRSWVFVGSDALNYLPQAPTTGLAGIPGLGDIGVIPVQTGLSPNQSILSTSGQSLSNGLSGSATWQLTSRTDLQGSATYQLLRFVGNSQPGFFNSNNYVASVGPDHRIDARDSVSLSAFYSRETYPDFVNARVESSGLNFGFTRSWTRAITTSITAGPETTHGQTYSRIPAKLDAAVSASISYAGRLNGASFTYSRAVNAGSGIIFGARTDTFTGVISHPFSRSTELALTGAYSRSIGLAPIAGILPSANTVYGGAQVSHRISETLSAYASYTAIHQSTSALYGGLFGSPNAFSGFNNIGAVGITFAPAPLNRGR